MYVKCEALSFVKEAKAYRGINFLVMLLVLEYMTDIVVSRSGSSAGQVMAHFVILVFCFKSVRRV